jgi:hemerythrin
MEGYGTCWKVMEGIEYSRTFEHEKVYNNLIYRIKERETPPTVG